MKQMRGITFLVIVSSYLLMLIEADGRQVFDYKTVVAPPIQGMAAPKLWEGKGRNIGDLNIPVSSSDGVVREHVRQGFALIHAQWDLEAYRHFAAALKRDPDCLMAYCGVVMSLLNPNHEWKVYRARAINRMVSLAEHKGGAGKDAEYVFPGNERDYALAIGTLVVNGLAAGSQSFKALADKYPNDLQLALLAPYFNRGGYDTFGSSDTKQDRAVKVVKGILERHPGNPLVTNFYIMMLVEAPHNAVDQGLEVLPYAKRLVTQGGADYPGWQMMLGYAAWRTGDMDLARDSFKKAVSLYEQWRKVSKAGISECDGLLRAYSFLTLVHYQMGNKKGVDSVMKKMAEGKRARKGSAVHALSSWSHAMMRVNMILAEGGADTGKRMLKALPKIVRGAKGDKLFNLMIKGYQAYGLARSYRKSGELEKAAKMSHTLGKLIGELNSKRGEAVGKVFYAHYRMQVEALNMYRVEMAAGIVGDAGAYNFYQEAIEKQMLPTRYYPPNILYPMEYRLAQYYEKQGDLKKARLSYKAALSRMPSHRESKMAFKRLMSFLGD